MLRYTQIDYDGQVNQKEVPRPPPSKLHKEQEEIDPDSSCSKKPTKTTALPKLLDPLNIQHLYCHICRALKLSARVKPWHTPPTPSSSDSIKITTNEYYPPEQIVFQKTSKVGDKDNAQCEHSAKAAELVDSRDYLTAFLSHFINVRNCNPTLKMHSCPIHHHYVL
jgi:hypothetical protein